MSTIASLNVDLALNTAKFIEGLRKARKEREDFVSSFSEIGNKAGDLAETLGIHVDSDFSLRGMIEKAQEAQESQAKLAAVVRATGEAAGFSVAGMNQLAEGLSHVTVYSQEAARSAETVLATFTHVRGNEFSAAIKAAADLATVFNLDLTTAAEKVGRALENPADGLRSLAKMGVQFTEQQKSVIQSLVDVGDTAKAQQKIIEAINAKVGGSAEAAANTAKGALQKLKNEYDEVAGVIGSTVLPAVTKIATAVNTFSTIAKTAGAALKFFADTERMAAVAATVLEVILNPASLALVGVATAAGIAVDQLMKKLQGESDAAKESSDAQEDAAKTAADHAKALKELASSAANAAAEVHGMVEKLKDVDIGKMYGSEAASLAGEIRDAEKRMDSIRKQAKKNGGIDDATLDSFNQLQADRDKLKGALQQAIDASGIEKMAKLGAELNDAADKLRESLMTPMEKFDGSVRSMRQLLEQHRIDGDTFVRGGARALQDLARATDVRPVYAAALGRGTVGAYSAALHNERDAQSNPLVDLAQKQLDEIIKSERLLQNLYDAQNNAVVPVTVSM